MILTMTLAILAGIIWFVRLEGRVNLLDRVLADSLKDRERAMSGIHQHLSRMEDKLDKISLRCAAFSGMHESPTEDKTS
jgi:uncharacterized protein with von Willebrand factor type A (vWA) domain